MLPALGLLTIALAAAPAPEAPKALPMPRSLEGRMLLCRPLVATPSPRAAGRTDAFMTAAAKYASYLLDYRNVCEGIVESAQAADDAGLHYGIMTTSQDEPAGSRFVLQLTETSSKRVVLEKDVLVPDDADAVKPLEAALGEIVAAGTGKKPMRWKPLAVTGLGVAVLAAGTGFLLAARSSASDRNGATTQAGYVRADDRRRTQSTVGTIGLIAGGVGIAAGLTWQLAF